MRVGEGCALPFPVLCGALFKDKVALAGGGGGARFGLPNRLRLLDLLDGRLCAEANTDDCLFERLFAAERVDALLAATDRFLRVYRVAPNGALTAVAELTFELGAAERVLLDCDGTTLLAVENESLLSAFSLEESEPIRLFSAELNEKVLNVYCFGEFALILLESRALIFSLQTQRCVHSFLEESPKSVQTLIARGGPSNELCLLRNGGGECRLVTVSAGDGPPRAGDERRLLDCAASAAARLGDWLLVGDVRGEVNVFALGAARRVARAAVHAMPITFIGCVRSPENGISLWSAALDFRFRDAQFAAPVKGEKRVLAFALCVGAALSFCVA